MPESCPLRIKAELVSLGGAVLLGVCLLVTALFVMALFAPAVTGMQRLIAAVLFILSWIYLVNSATEELYLVGHSLVYTVAFGRKRSFPLEGLEAISLIHQGFNLERGLETLEIRRRGRKPERLALGPCWQRHKLEDFMSGLGENLRLPALIKEIHK